MKVNAVQGRFALVAALALLIAGCAGGGYGGLADQGAAVQVRSTLPEPGLVDLTPDQRAYRIGPLDTISVNVFGAEELDRTGMVDAAGNFAMPLVGDIQVGGLTTAQVGERIAERLRGRYVRDPQVSVGVTEMRSQRVTIDGAVNQPGIYPVIGRMSLLQAIATARGTSEFASLDKVAVFRTVEGQRLAAVFSLKEIREGRLEDPQIFADDIVVVGESGSRRQFQQIIQSIPVLGVFTPVL